MFEIVASSTENTWYQVYFQKTKICHDRHHFVIADVNCYLTFYKSDSLRARYAEQKANITKHTYPIVIL